MSRIVGRPVPRVEGHAKVTGAAEFTADVHVPGALHGVMVLSTIARGRITRLETRQAERSAGVAAVMTHRNMPRLTVPEPHLLVKRFLPLQDTEIHHSGQPVALVLAETLEQAQHAATLVRVSYDTQPVRTVFEDAMDDAWIPPPEEEPGETPVPNELTRGDPEGALARADLRVDVTYTTPIHHHNPIEPSATTAVWRGRKVTVYDASQGVTAAQESIAQALDLPAGHVRVISRYLGGGFGCKTPWPHTVLTAAAAREVDRPVKLVLSRSDSYSLHGHRSQAHQRLRLGARRDGTLTAIDHVTTQQVSRTEDEFLPSASVPTRRLYACDNLSLAQRAVRLDLPTPAWMRSPEVMPAHGLECALDELAYAADMDPIELRLRNHTATDPETGEPFPSKHLKECYRRGATAFGWSERDPRPGSMRDGRIRIGWGMATAAHSAGGMPGAAARVTLSTEGTAQVQVATQDIGTGTYTVMSQMAAHVLGLTLDDVDFVLGDTNLPYASLSASSATVPAVGSAVNRTCTKARQELIGLAVADPRSPLHDLPADEITAEDGTLHQTSRPERRDSIRAVLTRHGRPLDVTTEAPEETGEQYSTGAVFAEVRVDPLLGQVRVTRMLGAFDPGRVLNRRTIRSQVIGGFIWAVGFTLTEHTLLDTRYGRFVNRNLSGYLIPVNADIPDIQALFIDQPDPTSQALGARGFGETPMCGMTAAIANAVHHATGRRIRDLPLTQDKLIASAS
ncbi:Aldehyde oxidoreductase molybdenum-binding subunit PaoC [Streptomyces sp. enrichment culture]|uniref:xanthine dehydrogenase family protein molybdopterin-binding subunit n=1 Tax=Streptomyces sp. enrichment culture TaxID=1795815 RepID=UPI003F56A655